jgi:hypothetical protein
VNLAFTNCEFLIHRQKKAPAPQKPGAEAAKIEIFYILKINNPLNKVALLRAIT